MVITRLLGILSHVLDDLDISVLAERSKRIVVTRCACTMLYVARYRLHMSEIREKLVGNTVGAPTVNVG